MKLKRDRMVRMFGYYLTDFKYLRDEQSEYRTDISKFFYVITFDGLEFTEFTVDDTYKFVGYMFGHKVYVKFEGGN